MTISECQAQRLSSAIEVIQKDYLKARDAFQAELWASPTNWEKAKFHSGRCEAFAAALGAMGASLPGI